MKQLFIICLLTVISYAGKSQNKSFMEKRMNSALPTIGILIFDGFLGNEVMAPFDVFTKSDTAGNKLFKVILIAKENKIITSDEGLKVLPDFTIANSPELNVLVVPSSMNPADQVNDTALVSFVKRQNESTEYTASHCAGAFMLGASGVADGKKVVTYCGGSDVLQKDYPKLLVQDDSMVKVVQDGKIISSNGNLVSYLASLDLLEKMVSTAHRKHVENELLIHKLKEYEHSY